VNSLKQCGRLLIRQTDSSLEVRHLEAIAHLVQGVVKVAEILSAEFEREAARLEHCFHFFIVGQAGNIPFPLIGLKAVPPQSLLGSVMTIVKCLSLQ